MTQDNERNNIKPDFLIPIITFLIALVPGVLSRGTMLTTDERLWLVRSPAFIDAFTSGN